MTDDERLAQIQERNAQRHRGSESGATMARDQADVGFLLRQLAEARELANLMYGILYAMPTSIGDHDERLDWDNKPGWLDGERIRSRP